MEIVSHCTKIGIRKLRARSALGVALILGTLSLLGWVYLTQASYVATTSRRLQELEEQKEQIEQENWQLMVEIAELESVTRLASRAQELGFVMAYSDETEFLAVADAPSVQARAPSAEGSDAVGWTMHNLATNVGSQFTSWAQGGSR
jgi:cell division protein FtsB